MMIDARRFAWSWLGFVLVALVVQVLANVGPYAALAHWQRDRLGVAYPATTALAIALFLAIPAFVALARAGPDVARDPAPHFQGHAKPVAHPVRLNLLLALAATALTGAVTALLLTLTLPSVTGQPATIALDHVANDGSAGRRGPVTVTGFRPFGEELRFADAVFLSANYARFLPLTGRKGGVPWLVVEHPDDGLTFDPGQIPASYTGVLAASGLPDVVESGLRARGALTSGPYWVLFVDRAALYRPYYKAALELMLAAIVLLAFAGGEWWKLHRIRPDTRSE